MTNIEGMMISKEEISVAFYVFGDVVARSARSAVRTALGSVTYPSLADKVMPLLPADPSLGVDKVAFW